MPGKLKYISSGDGYVIGVNNSDEIFIREGISSSQPTGTTWTQLSGKLTVVDSFRNSAWGVNDNNRIYNTFVQ